MNLRKIKSGFTLVELMVFFVFISLLMAASTPIISKRAANVPLKVHHGKFVCYLDESGNMVHDLYNATRAVISGAPGCTFTPPHRSAVYKIEMAGAGAGGFQFADITEAMETTNVSRIDLSELNTRCNSSSSNGVTCPSGSILYNLLNNVEFTIVSSAANANAGDNLNLSYLSPREPTVELKDGWQDLCWSPSRVDVKDENGVVIGSRDTTQEEDGALDKPACTAIEQRRTEVTDAVKGRVSCSRQDWCRTVVTENFIRSFDSMIGSYPIEITQFQGKYKDSQNVPYDTVRAEGGTGGRGVNLSLTPTIDFCNHTNSPVGGNACISGTTAFVERTNDTAVRNYLSTLSSRYIAGYSDGQPGSCPTSIKTALPTRRVIENSNNRAPSGAQHVAIDRETGIQKTARDGASVISYNIIKAWGACVTNTIRAEGGEGAWYINDQANSMLYGSSAGGGVRNGQDAGTDLAGALPGPWRVRAGADAATTARMPYISVNNRLSTRIHSLGRGGGAGEVIKPKYVTSLPGDCTFKVGRGGPAINGAPGADVPLFMKDDMRTTLTCGELTVSANGGDYRNTVAEHRYPGIQMITNAGQHIANTTRISSENGQSANFRLDSLFVRSAFNGSGYGDGGNGPSIYDPCAGTHGTYEVSSRYSATNRIRTTGNQNIERQACEESAIIQGTGDRAATAGRSGIIVISW